MINTSSSGSYTWGAGIPELKAGNCKPMSNAICSALASSAGIAGVPKEAVSAICNVSIEGLSLLSDAAGSGYDVVTDAIENTGERIGGSIDSVAKGAVSLYADIADMAEGSVDAVSDAAATAADGISSIAGGLTSYGAIAAAVGSTLLREVI